MNDSNGYDIDEPEGDEFDDLLRAMQTYHDPKQLQEFATRIPELIYAVRRARAELGEKLQAAKLLAQVAEQLRDERNSYQRMLDDERQESARLRQLEHEVSLRASVIHGRLMEAHAEIFALHDAVFDHNIASLGERTVEDLREADRLLAERAKELIEKRGKQ